MSATSVIDDLERYGPDVSPPAPSLAEARDYCRRLARAHYENFSVASFLLPRALRQHFFHVYAYCRWSDDLADETADRAQSLKLLGWWEDELRACYAGRARHPVFTALRETIDEFAIPIEPFAELLTAFRQDQTTTWYATFDELLGYCRNSANPVGRLVLYLGRCHDEERGPLSDSICTGLQLANFWQDVARDRRKGRVYLPQESLRRFNVADADLDRPTATPEFKQLLRFEVDRAEQFLRTGLPLVERMPRGLAGDVWLFAQGGLRILDKIRASDYDVLATRPVVTKFDQMRLLVGCLWRNTICGNRFLTCAAPTDDRGGVR
jgi:squalene synthase HpnC